MNPDATNPAPQNDEQTGVVDPTQNDVTTPPVAVPDPSTPEPTPPVADEAPEVSEPFSPPVGPTDTPAAPVVDSPVASDEQVPAAAPLPQTTVKAPGSTNKVILVVGLAALILVVALFVLLTI